MHLLIGLLISTVIVFVTAYILPGAEVDGWSTALVVAVVLSVINLVLKPILTILTLPITAITFGLFLFVINALMVMLVDWLVPGFSVDSFWWALAFSLVLSLIGSVIGLLGRSTQTNL